MTLMSKNQKIRKKMELILIAAIAAIIYTNYVQ